MILEHDSAHLLLGESLETIKSPEGQFELLSTSAGAEVVRGELFSGTRLTIIPDTNLSEVYYLIKGALRAVEDGRTLLVRAGQHVRVKNLPRPLTFTALGDTTFLYISSRPQFHLMSAKIRRPQKDGG